jgi:hypothetical protein
MSENIISVSVGAQGADSWYESQYESAKRLEVLGIACKDVIRNLCGVGKNAEPNRNGDVRARLQSLRQSILYKKLRESPFSLRIILTNPFSSFAKTREQEERNERCRAKILESIETLELLQSDLEAGLPEDGEVQRIAGKVDVSVIENNPYISLTRVTRRDNFTYIVVGFLVPGRVADRYPKLLFEYKNRRFAELFNMAEHVFARDEGEWVFQWENDKALFNKKFSRPSGYDIFLCHNSRDRDRVDGLRAELRAEGIGTWMDRWDINPGDPWTKKIEEILPKVRVAAVCIGSHDIGPWEAMELYYLFDLHARSQTRLIPIILEGVDGEPKIPGFLKMFQWIDLRKGKSEFNKLLKVIRETR